MVGWEVNIYKGFQLNDNHVEGGEGKYIQRAFQFHDNYVLVGEVYILRVFQFNDNRVVGGEINIYKGFFSFMIIVWRVGK